MNLGPELQVAFVWGQKNLNLAVGGLHRFSNPVAAPRAPKAHLCAQYFGLPVLALGGRPTELMAPRLLLNQGFSEPCYTAGKPQNSQS